MTKEIFNLYDWLPACGETEISFENVDKNLVVTVGYDAEYQGEEKYAKRDIVFTNVLNYKKTSFPVSIDESLWNRFKNSFWKQKKKITKNDSSEVYLNSLVEHYDTEELTRINKKSNLEKLSRSFSVTFLAEKIYLTVIAEDVFLESPRYFEYS